MTNLQKAGVAAAGFIVAVVGGFVGGALVIVTVAMAFRLFW